jgi:hypothetical protein
MRVYLPRHYMTGMALCACKVCNRWPIKCWWDVRAGGLQAWASTAQTCSTLTVACYGTEWFNNSGQAAQSDVQLQCNCNIVPALWTTRQAPLQCTVTQQHGVMLLTECGGADDKTRRTHTIEDIICYSWPLAPYRLGLYLPPVPPVRPWDSL